MAKQTQPQPQPQNEKLLIGIDVGTSATKVVAFDLAGNVKASSSKDYPLAAPKPNWAEQNPEDWFVATVAALREITAKIDATQVAGLSFSGQMHGSVFLDAKDQVIRPALLWCDGRTAPQCASAIETVGRTTFLKTIKNLPLTSFTLPKVLWLRENEKKNFARLRTVLLPKNYVAFRLSGAKYMDVADGAGTVMMEVGKKRWATAVLEKLEIDPAILPPIVDSTEVVGGLTAEAAKATGLPEGTPVVAGGGDQPVGATGMGVFTEGQVMVSLGTSGVIFTPTNHALIGGENGLASFDHAVPGSSYLMGCVIAAGGALQWYRNTLCQEEVAAAKAVGKDPYTVMLEAAAQTPIGAEGLLFMPYLMGERTPHNNPNARGAFFGLSVRTTKPHMTRAVIEGISFALRDCLELAKGKGITIKEVRVTGGGARSPFWLQTLADVFGVAVRAIENPEGAALGAAILAGVGTGVYKSFEEAAKLAIHAQAAVKPIAKNVKAYNEVYERFKKLYPMTKALLIEH